MLQWGNPKVYVAGFTSPGFTPGRDRVCLYLRPHSSKGAVPSAMNERLINSTGFHQHWKIKGCNCKQGNSFGECQGPPNLVKRSLWEFMLSVRSVFPQQDADGFATITTHLSCLDIWAPRTWHLLPAHLLRVTEQQSPGTTMSHILDSSTPELKP